MFQPTQEQLDIAAAFDTDTDVVVEALAGSGKTTTLKYLGEQHFDQNGLYIAYNKSIQEDAKKSFPNNVTCKTAHSVAFGSVVKYMGSPYGKKLQNSERMPSRVIAEYLGINKPFHIHNGTELTEIHLARMVMDTVRYFCNSAQREVTEQNVPYQEGLSESEWGDLKESTYLKAKQAWSDIISQNGRLKFEHDHYLKMWALSGPTLEYDFIMLDEAQDANPVIADVFEHQLAQKVMVGDTNQAIYGWRGAMDAMANFNGKRLYLSQSFRFGDAVAEQANKFLTLLESPIMVKGFDVIESVCEPIYDFSEPTTILCRTNAEGIRQVIMHQTSEEPKQVAFVGGGREIKAFSYHALALMQGKKPQYPYAPLVAFKDWAEVLDYVENDSGGSDLKVMVRLMKEFGPSAVIEAVDKLVEEKEADIVVSTAHKAKGREWDRVVIAPDFNMQKEEGEVPPRSELMLAYVAVTRAKKVLDIGGLSWIGRMV